MDDVFAIHSHSDVHTHTTLTRKWIINLFLHFFFSDFTVLLLWFLYSHVCIETSISWMLMVHNDLAQEFTPFECNSANTIRTAYYHYVLVKIDLAVSGGSGSGNSVTAIEFLRVDLFFVCLTENVNSQYKQWTEFISFILWIECVKCVRSNIQLCRVCTPHTVHLIVFGMHQAVKKRETFMTDYKKDSYGYFTKIVDSFLVSISKNKYFIMLKCKRYSKLPERAQTSYGTHTLTHTFAQLQTK